MNWLKDRYVVLSGASGGIGREVCKIFVKKYGAKVIGIGRNESKMQSLQAELGENFSYRLFDVCEKENWQAFAKWLQEENIAPVLLLNNAGAFPTFAKALDTPSQTTERIMQNNYFSIVYAVEAVAPLLKGDKKIKPAIVNVASSAALCTVAGTGAYSASKAAVKSFTEALQMEEKGKMYIGLICPGTTATELFDGDEKTKNSALQKIAMPVEKMAKKIARKIYKRKKRAALGWDAKLMSGLARTMPTKGLFVVRGVLKASKSKVFSEVFKDERVK